MSGKRTGPVVTPLNVAGFTLPDAAKAVGISKRTLRRAIADGRVKTVSVPQLKLIEPPEMARLLAEGLGKPLHPRIAEGLRRRARNGDGSVYWDQGNGKWAAKHQLGGRPRHVGYFDREEDARAALMAAKGAPP